MGNIPGLSVEAGGTDNLRVVTQGIGWEMFNSTDENMEVLITAEQVQGPTRCRPTATCRRSKAATTAASSGSSPSARTALASSASTSSLDVRRGLTVPPGRHRAANRLDSLPLRWDT